MKHKVYTPRPIIQFFTAVKHGNFQMKMYDFFFLLKNIDREFTYLNRLGCVGPVGVPKNVFLAVVVGIGTILDGIFMHSARGLN